MADSATNAVEWFEIPVSDLARAIVFYEAVTGVQLKPLEQGPYKMAWFPRTPETHGSGGALIQAVDRAPGRRGTLVYLNVPNLDAAVAAVQQRGGRIIMPKTAGDFGAIAHFEDSEGNLVALYSHDG